MIPPAKNELERFVETFLYSSEAFLVDEVIGMDRENGVVEARMDTTRWLPVSRFQTGDAAVHPRHVSAPDLVLLTGNLGCLHAYFFHGCRWDDGWVGFGNRIHRADFRRLVAIGPPLFLHSHETRVRRGARRVVLRYEFRFSQEGQLAYFGDQSAMFVKGSKLSPDEG